MVLFFYYLVADFADKPDVFIGFDYIMPIFVLISTALIINNYSYFSLGIKTN